jgi:hypothetical protein
MYGTVCTGYGSNIPEVQYGMYSMYGSNIPENSLHETVDNLLAGLDQLFRRLSVDLREGRRMSSNASTVASILLSYLLLTSSYLLNC